MAARKHLDLPVDDDMNISNSGISGKTLLGFGALMLAGVLGWRGIDRLSTPNVEPPTAVTPAASQEFEVRFWAEDGTEYEVQSSENEE